MTDQLVVGGQLGNYLIDSVIGRGGMSVVFGAKHSRLGMQVALKVLAPELSTDDTFRERFLREAQIAAGIDHPNVIPIHDMGLHEDSLYIVMRYVAGGDLRRLLSESGPLDLDRTIGLLAPVAAALDTAHRAGLVHRDVKPANILIQRSGAGEIEHVYLTDFGIAKSDSFSGALTGAGASIGTVGYMAPEQLEGCDVTAQTDIYALAATFYECLAGRVPFQRELIAGVRPAVGEPEPLSVLRAELPPSLDRAILKGLARDPAERFASCEEFIAACRAAAAERPAGALPQGGVSHTATSPALLGNASPALESAPESAGRGGAGEPPAGADASPRGGRGRGGGRTKALVGGLLVVAVAIAVAVIALSGSGSPSGKLSDAALGEVPTNHVTGSGEATFRLVGDTAQVTVSTEGLDDNAELVHLMHIHAGGKGECPPASAARPHNGHVTISTTDGINYYGPAAQALTTRGDTSVASILAFPRYPSGGRLRYTRTIVLPPNVVAEIQNDNAVVVIHGTDYDGTGIYSGVLDRSELNKGVPGTATAPALCGRLVAAQNASVHGASRLYTAALRRATLTAPRGIFFCHVGELTGALGEEPRRGETTAPEAHASA